MLSPSCFTDPLWTPQFVMYINVLQSVLSASLTNSDVSSACVRRVYGWLRHLGGVHTLAHFALGNSVFFLSYYQNTEPA